MHTESNSSFSDSPRFRALWWRQIFRRYRTRLLLLPLILYAAALNPFYAPGTYDDVVYYSGAVSLAQEGSFKFAGQYISDWPPGFSALMALLFLVFGESIWLAKIVVLLCTAAGLIAALRLFDGERRTLPVLSLVVFAMLPVSFMMGTRMMSEWPYFLASILFLLALQKLKTETQSFIPGILAGVLLGFAALTKFTGVLLGIAVMAQFIGKWRAAGKFRWRTVRPEILTALIGGGMFLLWKLKIQFQIQAGTAAPYEYYRSGWSPNLLGWFDPLSVPAKISDLFFHSDAMLNRLGETSALLIALASLPGLIVLAGLVIRLRSDSRTPADWYVLGLLLLFSATTDNQQTRYLMPVAPFLIGYGLLACQKFTNWFRIRADDLVWFGRMAAAGWILLLLASAGHLLFVGNLNGSHRGLFHLSSRTPEKFYVGFWRDLYLACERIKQNPNSGELVVIGEDDKYVTAFAERNWVRLDSATAPAFLLVLDERTIPSEKLRAWNLRRTDRYESISLYEKAIVPERTGAAVSAKMQNSVSTESSP